LLQATDIENGFTVVENGQVAAEVVFLETHPNWPDQVRAAYIEHLDRHSGLVLEMICAEAFARGLRRLRTQASAGDSPMREFFEPAGLRFRGIHNGAALFERILSSEDTRSPFPRAAYDGSKLPVRVLLDNIRSQYNTGSFFRTADAAGIERLYLCGITSHPPAKSISKTALGSEDRVQWEHSWRPAEVIAKLIQDGIEIAAVETSIDSIDLFDWKPWFPVCVVFGNEIDGISPEVLDVCRCRVRIPMLGSKHSLNVATAGGVVIYELLRKYRTFRGE
jgi:tRNA(Leu) C34 or U34 (ribose-2'-O)-methylase TrmL